MADPADSLLSSCWNWGKLGLADVVDMSHRKQQPYEGCKRGNASVRKMKELGREQPSGDGGRNQKHLIAECFTTALPIAYRKHNWWLLVFLSSP